MSDRIRIGGIRRWIAAVIVMNNGWFPSSIIFIILIIFIIILNILPITILTFILVLIYLIHT